MHHGKSTGEGNKAHVSENKVLPVSLMPLSHGQWSSLILVLADPDQLTSYKVAVAEVPLLSGCVATYSHIEHSRVTPCTAQPWSLEIILDLI